MEKSQSAPPDASSVGDVHEDLFRGHILAKLVAISWIIFLWELYLTFRQRRLMQKLVQPPKILDNLLSAEDYEKLRMETLDKWTFAIIKDLYSTILKTILVTHWGLNWGFYCTWEWGKDLVQLYGFDPKYEIYASAGCYTVMKIYWMIMYDLPFIIYETFVIKQKDDMNNQTPLSFIKTQIIKFLVLQLLVVPLICGIVWIVMNGGDYLFLYFWLCAVGTNLFLLIVYPVFIAPMSEKYSPMPEGDLKKRIEELASNLGFPLYKLYIVEGSRRSTHSNLYLYGFDKYKRIVLFDTLVAEYQKKKIEEKEEKAKAESKDSKKENRGYETDEIIALLAHELGHWHHSHKLQSFIFEQIIILCNLILFAQLLHYTPIYEAFGFTDNKPVIIGLVIATIYVHIPLSKLWSWALTVNLRRFEFQADRFAAGLGYGEALKRALVKLHMDVLGYPFLDRLFSNWYFTHPHLLERLDVINKND